MEIQGSVFLVTGAASGLGGATARSLSDLGAKVVGADINEPEAGERFRFVRTDVTSAGDVEHAVAAAAELGPLRGIIHAAGLVLAERVVGRNGPHALDAFSRIIRVNLEGTFNVIRFGAAEIMKSEPASGDERGIIITTASVAAFDGQIGQAAYAASKGGVAAMTLPVARELARYGIRVVTIAPGMFDTPLMHSLPQPARDSLAAQVPFPPRFGRPDEYASLVRHIIENQMLNGEVIRLDGAIRMAPK